MAQPVLTALERAIYECMRSAHPQMRLPSADHLVAKSRTNTGAGRCVKLWGISGVRPGLIDMGGQYVEMHGVPHGLMAADTHESEMEIATYGIHDWDGTGLAWRIV
jgi:hypothetical protein